MTVHMRTRGRWLAAVLAAVLVSGGCAAKSTESGDGDKSQVKIGWISDLSGAASIAGIGNRDGAKLAVKKVNSEGGVLGKKLVLDVVDEACKPETALAATQRFIDSSDTFMIAGGSCSGDVMAMKDVVSSAKVPFYVASASSVDIVEPASRYVFGNMVNTEQEAEFLTAAAVEKFKPKKLGIIYSANDYGQTGQEKVTATAKTLGVDVGKAIKVPVGTTDFSPFILLLKKQGVDVVVPVIYEVPAFVKQAKQNDFNAELVFFGSLPLRSAVLPLAEAQDLKGLSTSYWAPTKLSTDSDSPEMAEFVTTFKKEYQKFPDTADMNGYESILVIAAALQKAGKVDREAFIDALENMGPIDTGITYPVEYGRDDRVGMGTMGLVTFNDNVAPGPKGLFGTSDVFVPQS